MLHAIRALSNVRNDAYRARIAVRFRDESRGSLHPDAPSFHGRPCCGTGQPLKIPISGSAGRARARACVLFTEKLAPLRKKTGIIFMKRKRYREKYIALHLTCRCTGGHVIKPMLCEVLPSIECDEMFLFLFASTISPGPHVLAHTRMLHVPGYPPP